MKEQIKNNSFALKIVLFLALSIFAALMIYSESDRKAIRNAQQDYQSQISQIKINLDAGQCNEALIEYTHSKINRDNLAKSGLYYSLEPHALQAHAIEIAECFAKNDQLKEAIVIIESEEVHDPDYLSRAARIYELSGDIVKAEAYDSMASKFSPH